MSGPPGPEHFRAAAEFVLMLRRLGLRDTRVLRAMEQVPRVPFLRPELHALADEDVALPIACGQTMLAPSTTAAMIEALAVAPQHKVLLVGAGSGYMAAILGRLAARVVAVERWRTLADEAHERLRGLGYDMVEVVFGDGRTGQARGAPFDRVLFTCALEALPGPLGAQVAADGVVVAPILSAEGPARLTRFARAEAGFAAAEFGRAPIEAALAGVAARL